MCPPSSVMAPLRHGQLPRRSKVAEALGDGEEKLKNLSDSFLCKVNMFNQIN